MKRNELNKLMKTLNKHLNLNVFYSLCKEYNLIIKLETDCVIHAIIPSKYVMGSFILEYNKITDSLYMPLNIDRDKEKIYLFSTGHYSPTLFKIMCRKFLKLEKELKEIELQQRQDRLQADF